MVRPRSIVRVLAAAGFAINGCRAVPILWEATPLTALMAGLAHAIAVGSLILYVLEGRE